MSSYLNFIAFNKHMQRVYTLLGTGDLLGQYLGHVTRVRSQHAELAYCCVT